MQDLRSTYLSYYSSIKEKDRIRAAKMLYGLRTVLNELTKFIILLIMFAVFGKIIQFIFAFMVLLPTRIFSGGLHFQTNTACLVFTSCVFSFSVFIAPTIKISYALGGIIMITTIIVIYLLSPIVSEKRPPKKCSELNRCKWIGTISVITTEILLLILLVNGMRLYYSIGVWILLLQAIQLFIAWILSKWKGD